MTVKAWFLNKEFTTDERIAIASVDATVKRETDKAVLLCWDTDYGKISKWVPKSCIEKTPEISENVQKMLDEMKEREAQLEKALVKGAKVKKIGGRKIFTVTSDHISYGCVFLDNGKQVNIHQLVLV